MSIKTFESISFLIYSFSTYAIWLPISIEEIKKGYGLIPNVINFYNSVLLDQWWVFIRSNGRESHFLKLFSISKWFIVAGYAMLDMLIFILVMAFHFNHEKRYVLGAFLIVEAL